MQPRNRYLFHWLPPERLERFDARGTLAPSWRHWLLDHERMARGTCTTTEPMLWHPDDDLPREPCLIVDRGLIGSPLHEIRSSDAYHLTREILRLKRAGADIGPAIARERELGGIRRSQPDEVFVEGAIGWDCAAAIGFEDDWSDESEEIHKRVEAVASNRGLPLIEMSGWRVGCPGYAETDGIVDEKIAEFRAQAAPAP